MVIQAEELQKAIYKKVFIGDESMIAQYSNENRDIPRSLNMPQD